jgi:death-on-curing protein
LQSAIARPFQTFDKDDLYKSHIEKAAALIESIVSNHSFLDGNKRTDYVLMLMRLYLMQNGLDISASQDEKYDFVIAIASGALPYEVIVSWIESHLLRQ